MNSQELKNAAVTPLRVVNAEFESAATAEACATTCEAEALLQQFRHNDRIDPELKASLQDGLRKETDSRKLWFLLSCLEHVPQRTVATEHIYAALCRLAESELPMMRLFAYRWLAGLHRIDLRFENRARLKLRDRLAVETGRMQQRVEYLLGSC